MLRSAAWFATGVLLLGVLAWIVLRTERGTPDQVGGLPAGVTEQDIEAHNLGVAHMGRFDYTSAVDVFEPLAKKHAGWHDAQVDLGIALLNRSRKETNDLERALAIMRRVIAADAGHLRARHCAGLLLFYGGLFEEALPHFTYVAEHDPKDAYAAHFTGECHWHADRYEQAVHWFDAATRRDPSLRSSYYLAFRALLALGRDAEAQGRFENFQRLKDHLHARQAEIKYTRMGPHGAVRAIEGPGTTTRPKPEGSIFLPREDLAIQSAELLPWRTQDAARAASFTACDIDDDGNVDLFVADALRGSAPNLVLLRRGDGFVAQTGHALASAQASAGALWGDYDNDGLTDVYCGGLWRQAEKGRWEDVSKTALPETHAAHAFRAFVDADHDGDLDLLASNGMLANKRDGAFASLPDETGFPGEAGGAPGGLVLGDFDNDRDMDILVLDPGGPSRVYVNDRLWRWHADTRYDDLCRQPGARTGLALDRDADGQVEIYLVDERALTRWEPDDAGTWGGRTLRTWTDGEEVPSSLGVMDADGDGTLELLLTTSSSIRLLAARDGSLLWEDADAGPLVDCRPVLWDPARGEALVGLTTQGKLVIWRPGPGRHGFAALAFTGMNQRSAQMRSNASGIGVRAAVRVQTNWTVRHTYGACSGAGQSLQPLAVGLGGRAHIDFVDLLWSDGLLQTEMQLAAGTLHRIEETQRQTSSCPVLFVWDGRRFVFVTDLLGVGGLGFWVAPDTYAPPTPRETLLLPHGLLQPRAGEMVLKLGEPMEEACYLDGARLEALDLPPGWKATVDERMAVEGPAPTGRVVFYRREALPQKAVDQDGHDVLAALLRADHKAVDPAALDERFIGRTAEQVLTLTFAEPLTAGPGACVLVADGWIEYPYAQTMFAAWQAGALYEAPTIEARGADGVWKVVLKQFGYPAGMPRQMSVPLQGLPAGTRALRIRTTQEVYWDRLAVAFEEPCPNVRRRTLTMRAASLGHAGFARRTTGPQRLPHYDYGDRPPFWDTRHQAGWYTAFGAVDELVGRTDDAVVVFGPGEEVELRFAAPVAEAPAGWTRRYVLRCTGWCKDMDLFTKDGEAVGPLPVRAASSPDLARASLHERYQTRYRSGR